MSNFMGGKSVPAPRPRVQLARVAVAASMAVGAGVALHVVRRRRPTVQQQQPQEKRFLLPQPLVDAICGAVGEVSQIVLLYPLETIKVRCQSECISAAVVVRDLLRSHSGPDLARLLYAGLGSATALSVIVGAIHWLTFCTAKRAAMEYMLSERARDGAGSSAAAAAVAHVHGGTAHLHVSSGHHVHEEDVVLAQGGAAGSRPAPHAGSHGGHHGDGHVGDAAGGGGACAHVSSERDVALLARANMVGATVGALMTALVEGPLELFRHQAQAGIISGNLIREMGGVVRTQGLMGLYYGFLPYCFESFPYDISELATYSQLRDLYNQALARAEARPSRLFGPASGVPGQVWDIAIGAAAGSAATLVSMPFDVVKTYMQTHATEAISLSAGAQVAAFFSTGVRMVATRGPGALWVGVVPRLAQQVPSCTICWWAVEACQHALKPWTAPSKDPWAGH